MPQGSVWLSINFTLLGDLDVNQSIHSCSASYRQAKNSGPAFLLLRAELVEILLVIFSCFGHQILVTIRNAYDLSFKPVAIG